MAQLEQLALRRDPNAPAYKALRAKIIEARKSAGLSQEGLARLIGRPQSFVAKLERGERSVDVVELVAIGRLINLDIPDTLRAISAQL